jgi:hypothetical protein
MGIGTPISHSRLPVSISSSLKWLSKLADRKSVPGRRAYAMAADSGQA